MTVPLEIIENHLILVAGHVGGRPARLIVDTGAGVDLVAPRLAAELDLAVRGRFTGRRMTGEELTVELVDGPEFAVGEVRHGSPACGVHPILDQLPDALGRIDGVVSLRFFEDRPFTLDYPRAELRFGPAPKGVSVPMRLDREYEVALGVFVPVTLDGRIDGEFLIDTGNSTTIVNLPTLAQLGVGETTRREGRNETGHPFVREYGAIAEVAVGTARQQDPTICFEAIRYDGVLGNDFLSGFAATIDVSAGRLTLTR